MRPARQLGAEPDIVDKLKAVRDDAGTAWRMAQVPWWAWLALGYAAARMRRAR